MTERKDEQITREVKDKQGREGREKKDIEINRGIEIDKQTHRKREQKQTKNNGRDSKKSESEREREHEREG